MRRTSTVWVMALLAAAFAACGGSSADTTASEGGAASSPSRAAATCPGAGRGLGLVAFARGHALYVLDLADCRARRLLGWGVDPPVRFSGDGTWIGFGRGLAVSAAGGAATRPLEAAVNAWAWAPRAAQMAGVTRARGVVIGAPGQRPRRLLAAGWGAESLAFDHAGRRLAVARTPARRAGATRPQELWIIDTVSERRSRAVALRRGLAPPLVAGWSPDDRWVLFWRRTQNSASLQADGLPLFAAPVSGGRARRIAVTLAYDDFVADCGRGMLLVAGPIRTATTRKRLVVAEPPGWQARTLATGGARSWSSPACGSDGRRVVAPVGPADPSAAAAATPRHALWLLDSRRGPTRRLTDPPGLASDELPRLSAEGRAILFVRATRRRRVELPRGQLWLIVGGRTVGPLADLGRGSLYYNHDNWAQTTDWHQRRQRAR